MLTDFQNSLIGRLSSKFAVQLLLNFPSHLKHIATLPCLSVQKCHAQELSEERKISLTEWPH